MLRQAVSIGHSVLMGVRGFTKSHEANFPNKNCSNDETDRKGGDGLNNTEQKCQHSYVQPSRCKKHARSKSDASQTVNFLWGIAQV
jgi:hypothetical protein